MTTLTLKPKDPDSLPFEQWAVGKYKEIIKQATITDEKGNIEPFKLNSFLANFTTYFTWAITVQEIETSKFNVMTHDYERWSKEAFDSAYRSLREESGGVGRAPTQALVEARMMLLHGDDIMTKQKALSEQRSRVDLLRGLVKVLDRQAGMVQTLSSNMRSEMFFASGVNISGGLSEAQKSEAAKAALHGAMRRQGRMQTEEEVDNQVNKENQEQS